MSNKIKTFTVSLAALAVTAMPAWAHSGPGAHHDFGPLHALEHIFTSPDHLAKIAVVTGILIAMSAAAWRVRKDGRDRS